MAYTYFRTILKVEKQPVEGQRSNCRIIAECSKVSKISIREEEGDVDDTPTLLYLPSVDVARGPICLSGSACVGVRLLLNDAHPVCKTSTRVFCLGEPLSGSV